MLQALRGSAACTSIIPGPLQRLLAVLQQHETARSLQQSEGLQHAVSELAKTSWPLQPWAVGSSRRLQTDARLPLERLQEAITPEVCAELNAKVWHKHTKRCMAVPMCHTNEPCCHELYMYVQAAAGVL